MLTEVDRGAPCRWLDEARKSPIPDKYRSGEAYEPDFVVEPKDRILICEIKALKWCRAASEHAASNGGKPWCYALIPYDQILANASVAAGLQGLDAPPTAAGAAQIDPSRSLSFAFGTALLPHSGHCPAPAQSRSGVESRPSSAANRITPSVP
jgi:hypothetical protein